MESIEQFVEEQPKLGKVIDDLKLIFGDIDLSTPCVFEYSGKCKCFGKVLMDDSENVLSFLKHLKELIDSIKMDDVKSFFSNQKILFMNRKVKITIDGETKEYKISDIIKQ